MDFTNNYNNNLFNGGAYPNQQREPKFTNPLSDEEIKKLRQSGPAFTLKVSPEEMTKAICTHRVGNKKTLVNNGDGTLTCTICGATYRPFEGDKKTVEEVVNAMDSIFQTIKTLYLDIPDEVCRTYFQMLPYIEKAPKLFEIAAKNFESYTGTPTNPINQNTDPFMMMQNIMGGGMFPQQPMMPQYGYNPQMQQMPYNQQPYNNGMNGMSPFQSTTNMQADNMMNNVPQQDPSQMNNQQQQNEEAKVTKQFEI